MKVSGNATRRLQRALNALNRGTGTPHLRLDGQAGRRTLASFIRFLAARGPEGEARLARGIRALGNPHGQCEHWEHWRQE